MIARPRDAAISSATRRRSSRRGADDDDLGAVGLDPRALDRRARRTASRSTAGTPSRRAARATPCAWLPDGVGDQPAGALGRRRGRGGDVRAADLERPDRLERLGLEPLVAVRGPERDERRADGDAPERRGGGADVVERRRAARRPSPSAGATVRRRPSSAAAARWQSMHSAADGSASRRSARSACRTTRTGRRCPASRRARAASTAARCCAVRSRSARSRCCSNTWVAAAACEP